MIKDNCGCVVERKYASDFLSRQIFRVNKKPKGYEKIAEIQIDGRTLELYYINKEEKKEEEEYPLKYKCSECPLLIIVMEALCEKYAENKHIDFDTAIKTVDNIKGLTRNQFVTSVIKQVVSKLEENSIYN
ncbi:hypothetical protein [Acidianus manzaensis]|uniref:Uncharacterized protein n=1 Tax=Acidianus manzaensis TaxID=282676 RepID=A0A1W6K345_9CREN|nr:hypothetical protein [Acidianus manzaensis]ARM76864.1 hypothetical protein B6F84_13095 [Acidianus manzaensis]